MYTSHVNMNVDASAAATVCGADPRPVSPLQPIHVHTVMMMLMLLMRMMRER